MFILLPILALVFLSWAPSPSEKPRLKRLILPVIVIGFLWHLAIGLVSDLRKYPARTSMGVTQIAVERFRAAVDKGNPIILLEGSSLTTYGINGAMIEDLLGKRGMPVTVLQLSSPGANHYERLKMFSEFLRSLTADEREKLKASRVFLLREILREYDENPMKYLESDSLQRNVHYTDLSSFPKMWRIGGFRNDATAFRWNLTQCTLLHETGVGIFPGGKVPRALIPPSPYKGIDWGIPKSFDFDAAWNEFAEGYVKGDKIGSLDEKVPFAIWESANADLQELLGPYVDKVGYFAAPVLAGDEVRYQRAFLNALSADHPKFGPAAPGLYQILHNRNFWYDPRHTTLPASIITTMWMEAQIAAQWNSLFPDR